MRNPQRPGGELIARLPEDMHGGDNSPYNYGLWCGGCGNLLGRLGTFTEALDIASNRRLRKAHCSVCHATSLVEGRHVNLLPPARLGGVCGLCGKPMGQASVRSVP